MALARSAFQQAQEAAITSNVHTTNALKRWSVGDRELPSIETIKHIHVYDFDNTLFASPLPNRQLWRGETIGQLQGQDVFVNGGWWHDARILASTGKGVEIEEARGWSGWWNEQIVELVQLSMEQNDALCVLLTGRAEGGFADLIKRIVKAKGLEFDLICLKPEVGPSNQRFGSTMLYKQAFLADLIRTYRDAEEFRIYEDRPKHVTGFREFLTNLNKGLLQDKSLNARKSIETEVIEVSEQGTSLDPMAEIEEVQKMINEHNIAFRNGELNKKAKAWQIKRQFLYLGYLVSPTDSDRLLALANLPPKADRDDNGTRRLGDNIMITPRPPLPPILKRCGGIGKKMRWRVSALGDLNNQLYAAQVEPANPGEDFITMNKPPAVILGLRGTSRPADVNRIGAWQPLPKDKQFEFDTTVGEKVLFSIEQEFAPRNSQGPQMPNSGRGVKRPYSGEMNMDEDFPALSAGASTNQPRQQYQSQASNQPAWGNRPQPQTRSFGNQSNNSNNSENRRPVPANNSNNNNHQFARPANNGPPQPRVPTGPSLNRGGAPAARGGANRGGRRNNGNRGGAKGYKDADAAASRQKGGSGGNGSGQFDSLTY